MYKIDNYYMNYVTILCLNNESYYYYHIQTKELYRCIMTNEYSEYALGAEEYAKKWLEHNKDWI